MAPLNGNRSASHRSRGGAAERAALDFLKKSGLRVVEQNVHCGRMGELDIVAREGEVLVFVEVKSRRTKTFGTPEEGVTPAKQRRLRRLASFYLHTRKQHNMLCRFDVVAIDYSAGVPAIRHIKNAFV